MLIFFTACRTTEPEPAPEALTIEYLITLPEEELMERDSDGDGLSDYDEIYIYGTDPLDPDTDGDGLTDYDEIFVYGTDPLNPDTDGDGFTDGQEVEMGTDPLDPDDPTFIHDRELHSVYFSFGEAGLTAEATELLNENAEILNSAEEFRVSIIALQDESEISDDLPENLHEQRANMVKAYYIGNGIPEERIDIHFETVATGNCPEDERDERGSCRENRKADSLPLNPYPYDPEN